jgi:hypothetical protein
MDGDDDGFVKNPYSVMRIVGASKNDMDLLIAKKFIIVFESGVIVIKHWRMHNYIRNDRYKPTVYQNEMALLDMKENKAYRLKEIPYDLFTNEIDKNDDGRHLVYQLDTQDKLSKVKLSKDNKNIITHETEEDFEKKKKFIPPTLEEVEAYCKKRNSSVDPKAFYDYFTEGKWKDSFGKPVKSWKQKIITWEGRNNNKEVSTNAKSQEPITPYVRREDR